VRILHIVENLDKGAVENWLVRTFKNSLKFRPDHEWTFYCVLGKKGRLDDEVIRAGGKIIYSPYWLSEKAKFLWHLKKELTTGKYDVIHSHHDYLTGFYWLSTIGIPFKKRITHLHNNDKLLPVSNLFVRNTLLSVFRNIVLKFSDTIIGISKHTLEDFVGAEIVKGKHIVHYYGIDFSRYKIDIDRNEKKASLGISPDAKLVLFVGRMDRVKNPGFVLSIMKELAKLSVNCMALLVGKGDLEDDLKSFVKEHSIDHQVRFLGWRDDVLELMAIADVFVFPRLLHPKEGLGLVVVEAQAMGLHVLTTHGIVDDAIVINEMVDRLPLDKGDGIWIDSIRQLFERNPAINHSQAIEIMQGSAFDLDISTKLLLQVYEN
jgi:glycosyltransferase involved in cell wall biosynthesis